MLIMRLHLKFFLKMRRWGFFWGGSSPHLDESGPTRFALVWLFSRVDTSMSLEIGWPVKLSSADVAVVWLCTWRLRKAGEYNNSLP